MVALLMASNLANAQLPPTVQPRFDFTRMLAHWSDYGDPDYLDFVNDAQPELVQFGFYGGHFWSLSHTPSYKGYPAHFPVQGLDECGNWFEEKNRQLHARGVKVVGHFNVEFLVGDPDGPNGPTGFFKFYRDGWDEKELGPRPVADPLLLLEKNADGTPISQKGYGIGKMQEYWGCLRNPHWQAVLKAWTKRGIERGVDGLIANYFYRHNCLCEHCQRDFRAYLAERFTPMELQAQFGIDELASHQFTEIVAWHKPEESTPLKREMLRFSQLSNKQVFDKVLVKYGRSLKPDLIVAQWDHLGNFHMIGGDERCMLPADVWGRDESYLWYSTGAAACYTDLANGFCGDGTLQARYIRGMFDNKPYTLGKYEGTRIRAAIGELAANGGCPMGFYTRFKDPAAREEIVRYYQFLKRYDEIYRGNRSHAEVALLFPRTHVFAGDLAAVEQFRQLGKQLLEAHVLFDVLSDEPQHIARRASYRHIFAPEDDASAVIAKLTKLPLSSFAAASTVRVSANRAADENELDLHFVNYNRVEPPPGRDGKPSAGRGIQEEKPIAAQPIVCKVVLPAGFRAASVVAISPETAEPQSLEFQNEAGAATFTMPEFLVYGVARIRLQKVR
jgi:hypothetical protein